MCLPWCETGGGALSLAGHLKAPAGDYQGPHLETCWPRLALLQNNSSERASSLQRAAVGICEGRKEAAFVVPVLAWAR